jgi:predicted small lipoprotein YifL
MSEDNVLTRREFTVESALAMLATVAITITGCGDDSPPTTPTPPVTDKTGAVSTDANHTHNGTTITAAQFTAGNAVTLTLTGATTHTHTLALSQAELTQINAGTRVQKTSTSDGPTPHIHTVTFN